MRGSLDSFGAHLLLIKTPNPQFGVAGEYCCSVEALNGTNEMGASESDCLSIQQEEGPGGTVLHVSGEVDLSNAELLRGASEPIIHNCRNVVMDFQVLHYIDSVGLKILFDSISNSWNAGAD